jgi:hypothetical protein
MKEIDLANDLNISRIFIGVANNKLMNMKEKPEAITRRMEKENVQRG